MKLNNAAQIATQMSGIRFWDSSVSIGLHTVSVNDLLQFSEGRKAAINMQETAMHKFQHCTSYILYYTILGHFWWISPSCGYARSREMRCRDWLAAVIEIHSDFQWWGWPATMSTLAAARWEYVIYGRAARPRIAGLRFTAPLLVSTAFKSWRKPVQSIPHGTEK